MAKKKKNDVEENEELEPIEAESLEKEVVSRKWEKEFGDIFQSGEDILNDKIEIVPISPAIDLAIRGVPEGSWVILSGPEKCGKTTLALQIAANAQKMGKHVFYDDVEGRFKKMNLSTINTLNPKMFTRIRSTKDKILSAEDHLNIDMDKIRNNPGCVMIIDSSSALCAEKELTSDITASTRVNGPKLLASFCRQMAHVIPVNKVIIIIINHLIANTSGYGLPFMEDGGTKIKFQSDIKLRCTGKTKWLDREKTQVGQIVNWEVLASAMGPPGAKIESYIRYGVGIDSIMETIELSLDSGILQGSGWMTTGFETINQEYPDKIQGKENLYEFLHTHPDCLKYLQDKLCKLLG